MKSKITFIAMGLAAGLALSPISANAQTVTPGTPFTVQVTVTAGCSITTDVSPNVDFGSHPGTGPAPADQNRTASVTCTNGTPYDVYFTSVNAMSGTNRIMVSGPESIGYQILHSSVPVGDTAGTGISATGSGAAQAYPLVFNINNWTPVAPNTYTDTVTMQVEF